MLRIIKHDWDRLMEEKGYLFVSILLTVCAIVAAVFLTNKIEAKGSLALVSYTGEMEITQNPYYNIELLEEEPPLSYLVQNRYQALVIFNKDRKFRIKTLKNTEFKKELEQFLLNNNPNDNQGKYNSMRKVGTNIIGYMMMFLFIQGVLYTRFFAEDKEKHMIKRVAMSPISFTSYILGHGAFTMLLVFMPSFTILFIMKLCGIAMGFTLVQYLWIIGVMAFFAAAFAICLNSFFCVADTANMVGSAIIMLSSILGGTFYSFTKHHSLFDYMIHILPQKDFINFVDALEKENITTKSYLGLVYVLVLAILFLAIGVFNTRRQYVYK